MELLKKLCVPSVCGYEEEIADIIKDELEALGISYVQDANKTVVAHIKGDGKPTMFIAAMDTPGTMITFIEEKGFLRVSPLGSIKSSEFSSRRVALGGGERGVMSAGENFDDMFVDIGADSYEAAAKRAGIGDFVSLIPDAVQLGDKLSGYRIGKTAIIYSFLKAAEELKKLAKNTYLVFAAKTEHGPSHGFLQLLDEVPLYAYLIGTTEAVDLPEKENVPVMLGRGITLRRADGGIISSSEAIKHAEECAGDVLYREVTDKKGFFDKFQSASIDTHTAAVSLPVRYRAGVTEVLDVRDIKALHEFLISL